MEKRIYLVRHGQTEANIKNAIQDLTDPLTPLGTEQTEFIAKRLKNVPFDALLSSDAVRAKKTAEAIAAETGHAPEYFPLFREHAAPSSLVGIERSDSRAQAYFKEWNAHTEDSEWHYADEENFCEFRARAAKALTFLSERPERSVAVVTHGNLKRAMIGIILFGPSMPFPQWDRLRLSLATSNTAVTVLSFKEGAWRIITWNDIAHLAE